jgi:DHA2 family multidrug resistance protein
VPTRAKAEAGATAAAASAATLAWHPSRSKWLIAFCVMLAALLPLLDGTIVNVSLPYMQRTFGVDLDHISWVLTSYLVSSGIVIPLTGWIAARIGRKRYFLISVVAFVIASALCGAAASLPAMVVFRFVQGAAGAAVVPTSQAILMEVFPPAEHALAMAVWGMGMMVAPVMGPTIGGWITENWTWRWNFYINLPVGAIAFALVYMFIEDPPYLRRSARAQDKVDYPAIAYLVLGLSLLQIVLDRGQRSGWFAAPWVVGFTLCSVAFLSLLVIRETRVANPVLDLRVFRLRSFRLGVSLLVMTVFVVFGVNLMNPVFLQQLMGYGPAKAGYTVAVRGLGVMVSMLVVGQLSRMGYRTVRLVGVGFFTIAFANWQMARWDVHVSSRGLIEPIFLSGIGAGMVFPNLSALSLSFVQRERMGYATGLFNMMRNMGSAFGVSAATNLLLNRERAHYRALLAGAVLSQASPARRAAALSAIRSRADLLAFHDVYQALALVALMLFIPALWLPRAVAADSRKAAAGGSGQVPLPGGSEQR